MTMTKQFLVAVSVFALTLVSCSQIGTHDIPQNYRQQILKLRDDSVSLTRKCSDLQKQMAELQAQINWDHQQLDITAGEALNSLGYSSEDWRVNADKMTIEPKPKK